MNSFYKFVCGLLIVAGILLTIWMVVIININKNEKKKEEEIPKDYCYITQK